MDYKNLLDDFSKYHKSNVNIIIHCFTVILGIYGIISLLLETIGSNCTYLIIFTYIISLFLNNRYAVPISLSLLTSLIVIIINYFAISSTNRIWENILYIIMAYTVQEFSHFITNERTYQSSYIGDRDFYIKFIIHNYLLLPFMVNVVLDSDLLKDMILNRTTIFNTSLDSKGKEYCSKIHEWCKGSIIDHTQKDQLDKTIHCWYNNLPFEVKDYFYNIKINKNVINEFYKIFPQDSYNIEYFRYDDKHISSNENKGSSDNLFRNHIDGPYVIYPFAKVYRCLTGINDNKDYKTIFPCDDKIITISKGDVYGFDYNKDPPLYC